MMDLFFAFLGAAAAVAFLKIPNKAVGVLICIILFLGLFLRWVKRDFDKREGQ